MENFVVSARKYRPKVFDEVVGQKSIIRTLKNAIKNNHLAQSFLFCGPRGIGKTTCARILAKTINCEHITDNIEPCNKCESCISFNNSTSFNIHELDAASNNTVDGIRNLIEQVRIPPQVGKYKIYIIDEVHMLSPQAFNAFLKTLEEPPSYAKFILATTERNKIIPTILSRCQIYNFRRISIEDIAKHLEFVSKNEKITVVSDALHIIAQKADGSLRDALSIFDQIVSFKGNDITYKDVIENLNILDYDYYFKITDSILKCDIPSTLLLINEIIDNGFDEHHFINGFGEHLRNLLVCKDVSTIRLLEAGKNIRNRYKEQSSECSQDFLLKALDINNKCDINYNTSNNKRLLLELSLMQISSVLSDKDSLQSEQYIIPSLKKKEEIKEDVVKPYHKKEETVLKQTETNVSDKADTSKIAPYKKESKTLSIREEMSDYIHNKNKVEEDNTNKVCDDFSQDELETVWNKYAESISKEFPNFFSILAQQKPILKEDYLIELAISNRVQEEEINSKKTNLLGFIREKLNNYKIQMQTVITESKGEAIPYSPIDKYKRMAKKNPDIKKLKDKLNLEIEF